MDAMDANETLDVPDKTKGSVVASTTNDDMGVVDDAGRTEEDAESITLENDGEVVTPAQRRSKRCESSINVKCYFEGSDSDDTDNESGDAGEPISQKRLPTPVTSPSVAPADGHLEAASVEDQSTDSGVAGSGVTVAAQSDTATPPTAKSAGVGHVSRKRSHDEAFSGGKEGKSVAVDESQKYVDPEDTMFGCSSVFDSESKCVGAACGKCLTSSSGHRRMYPRNCRCRGANACMRVKELSDKIYDDWKIGKNNNHDEKFKDLLFSWPVECSLCNRFISEEVELMVNKEVESDKERKQSKDPNWVPRDWVTLRSVVHESWDN